ncbi:amidophosphoribosyltransferase [Litorilinea aerophila]|uniref:Amidophosphoribosyltransferase n=1 Tax=Litorilinea aerophila TaxID=1204385 RepID=A0A540VGA6_9CHLR|nr:amidophosphoribosyltransferase [Litorilinea aerophila]MCC9076488.1 amidophosphoribosyltransferase [Litorilinea aerophila]GIV79604.1 MAG: amidophosphoribosyltransferase [Litorilinea sp.]
MYSDDKLHEECGIFGIYAPDREAARRTFFGLYALQHRGQEGAGIVSCDGRMAHIHKGMGLVSQVFNEENLRYLQGHMAIGHTRYSTTGSTKLRNTQPYILETLDGPLAIGHNGNLINAPQLRRELLERGVGLQTSTDSEVIIHLLAGAGGPDWPTRIRIMMAKAEGAYSLVILTREAIYGVRDPWGLRPLVLGELEGGHVLASESCAFATIGARMIREIQPGEIVRLDHNGYEIMQGAPPQKLAFCTFEQIYFARPDSVLNGRLVHQVRQKLGRQLAKEAPVKADIVIPVPDSGTPHAIGYAQKSGIPYSEGLIKSRYIGRTFIEPTDQLRKVGVAMKFNPLPDNLKGRRVIMVDDSIVRGNTSGPLVQLLRDAGAREVHVRVACPPIKFPCFMGVDMATQAELIAANKSIDEICEHIGADSLAFLSISGMMKALKATDGYCNACFTGEYPFQTPIPLIELQEKEKFPQVWGN